MGGGALIGSSGLSRGESKSPKNDRMFGLI
jgi:hypothetical protein